MKAYQRNEGISVEWNVANETGIKKYEIEKSGDGVMFILSGAVDAKNSRVNNYKWVDVLAEEGYNYYRIKSIDLNGKLQYSKIVQVFISKRNQEITIYPNPVINGIINLQFVNQPIGVYHIRLANKAGQMFVSKEINHPVDIGTEKIEINANAAHGIYDLEIIKPDKSKVIKKIIY